MTGNKQFVSGLFDALSTGNSRPFVEALADDVRWTVTGNTPWSKTYTSKASVLKDLLGELGARLSDRYRATAERILADGDFVVVQARGKSTTKKGMPYNNEYCFVYRVENGSIKEVTEYLDTQLTIDALGSV
jgi:ketosteroid isomerase-like protein